MKVLTIKEPYASLIAYNLKEYETRSWKTNYRGKIYIHASKNIDNIDGRDKVKKIVSDNNITYKPGYILCEAELTDCIYMDNKFISSVPENEKVVGNYEVGRYAWKLSNVKLIRPIYAKGHLGIWNYESEDD